MVFTVTPAIIVMGTVIKIRKKSSVCKGSNLNRRMLTPRDMRIILRIP